MRSLYKSDGRHERHAHAGADGNHEAAIYGLGGGDRVRRDRGESGHRPGRRSSGYRELVHFGGRARRGEVRYVVLDALGNAPMHGYEIVKAFEERSAGQYVPSPGVIYPTLQFLLDEGLVSVSQEGDRRVFKMTDAGKVELEAHAAEVEGFWARFADKGVAQASRHEVTFLNEELDSLSRTIWGGLGEAIERGDQEMIRSVRQVVVRCREDIRGIISAAA